MSKYEPLRKFVAGNSCGKLTFEEIKNILGFEIDHSFLSFKKELKEYGFEVEKFSIKEKIVYFKKI